MITFEKFIKSQVLRFVFEATFSYTVCFTARTNHSNTIGITKINPPVVFWMIVKIMDFYFFYWSRVWFVLQISYTGLDPVGAGMKSVYSIVGGYGFSWFPLGEYAVWPEIDIFVIFIGRSRVMNIGFESLDVDNLSIDPFVFGVLNIYILPQIKLEIIFLA